MKPTAECATAVAPPMFRSAVLGQAGQRRYGTILLARPTSYAVLTMLFAAIAGALILFFALFRRGSKAH